MAGRLMTPDELRRSSQEKEREQMRAALEKKRRTHEECHQFHETFMHQDLRPDALERVSALVRGAAERGEREALALRFPSEYCSGEPRGCRRSGPVIPANNRLSGPGVTAKLS